MSAASKYIYSIVGFQFFSILFYGWIKKKYRTKVITYIFAWGCYPSLYLPCATIPLAAPHRTSDRIFALPCFIFVFRQCNAVRFPLLAALKWVYCPNRSLYPSTPSAFIFKCDLLITIFALLGLPKLFQKYRLYFMWLIIGIGILLIWPTKWPQYTQIIIVPYCLSAAMGISTLINLGKNLFLRYNRSIHKNRGSS